MALKERLFPLVGELHQPHGLAADYATCRQIMQAASKNYTFAGLFLPPDKRPHVEALYAVMRVGDDRVDVAHPGFISPLEAIKDWETSYWRAFETGDSPEPVLRAYLHTCQKFDISPDLLAPYFRAMREDLTITRFPTFDHLLHYMDGSAITVGRVMVHILGTKTRRVRDAFPAADALSIAMQLSNFWRDIGQDWRLGRVYIPQEDLAFFEYSESELAAGKMTPNFIRLLEFEMKRTERYYQQAREGINLLASGQWGVMCGLEIYSAILTDIRRSQYAVFARRAGANTLQKMVLAVKALVLKNS